MHTAWIWANLAVGVALMANPAVACNGKTEIFNVDLTDEDALQGNYIEWQIGKGKATTSVAKGKIGYGTVPDDVTVSDIDLCVTFKSVRENGPNATAGLTFWEEGDLRYLALVMTKRSTAYITTNNNKGWKDVTKERKVPYKAGEANTLRVTLHGTDGVGYLNGQEFVKFKRKDAPDSFTVGVVVQDGDWEVTKLAGTSLE